MPQPPHIRSWAAAQRFTPVRPPQLHSTPSRIEIDAKVRTGTRPPCIQIHAIDAGSRINQSIAPVPHPVTQVLNLTLKMDKAAEHDAGAGP